MIRNLLPTVWRRGETPLRQAEENPFLTLHREMNRMFDDFLRGSSLSAFDEGKGFGPFSPAIDVKEDGKTVTVKAELPGIEEKDLKVTLSDHGLVIQGEKRSEQEEKGKDYWRREASYGSFRRLVPLPEGIDTEKVDARFKNGVLTITIDRLEEAKPKGKKVDVRSE